MVTTIFHPERMKVENRDTAVLHPERAKKLMETRPKKTDAAKKDIAAKTTPQQMLKYYSIMSKGEKKIFHKKGDVAIFLGNTPHKNNQTVVLDFETPAPHSMWYCDNDRDAKGKPPESAQLVYVFRNRIRIFDESGKTFDLEAPVIYVYRRGDELFVDTANNTSNERKRKRKEVAISGNDSFIV